MDGRSHLCKYGVGLGTLHAGVRVSHREEEIACKYSRASNHRGVRHADVCLALMCDVGEIGLHTRELLDITWRRARSS